MCIVFCVFLNENKKIYYTFLCIFRFFFMIFLIFLENFRVFGSIFGVFESKIWTLIEYIYI